MFGLPNPKKNWEDNKNFRWCTFITWGAMWKLTDAFPSVAILIEASVLVTGGMLSASACGKADALTKELEVIPPLQSIPGKISSDREIHFPSKITMQLNTTLQTWQHHSGSCCPQTEDHGVHGFATVSLLALVAIRSTPTGRQKLHEIITGRSLPFGTEDSMPPGSIG